MGQWVEKSIQGVGISYFGYVRAITFPRFLNLNLART